MKTTAQIKRIKYYEGLLDELSDAEKAFSATAERLLSLHEKAGELESYYTGKLWKKDHTDDEAGRIPPGLKRGVLSEDAVCDVLDENRRLISLLNGYIDKN